MKVIFGLVGTLLLAGVLAGDSSAANLETASVEVSFDLPAAPGAAAPGVLKLTPVSGDSAHREKAVQVPGATRLELPLGSTWRFVLDAPGFWAPAAVLSVERPATSVEMSLWRTGTVGGELSVPRGERLPRSLQVRFRSEIAGGGRTEPPAAGFAEATLECPVDRGEWRCDLPAARLDLRLRARGFVSHYRWGVEVRPRQLRELGRLDLKPGASLVGVLEASQGPLLPQRCKVWISPYRAASPSALDRAREKEMVQHAEVGERGLFHFRDVRPGSYVVQASQEGLGSTTFYPVAVMENAETELQRPLVLEPPLQLAVSVTPPVDPLGRLWGWKLYQRSDVVSRLEAVAQGELSTEGTWVQGGLESGEYQIGILDAEGSRFAFETVELKGASEELYLELPVVFVEGTVRLGERPLVADLVFGGLGGEQKIELKSDEDGRFFGILPREGLWKVLVWSESPQIRQTLAGVEVEVAQGAGEARLDLELPDTELTGTVLDEAGDPVFAATVRLVELEGLLATSLKTAQDGTFTFLGVAEGAVSVVAQDGGRESDQMTVRVAQGIPAPELQLIVRENRQLHGRVVSSAGGVPGAQVLAGAFQAGGGLMLFGRQAGTDVEGSFHLDMPAVASHLQLAVFAPGYALALARVSGDSREEIVIEVQPVGGELTLELGSDEEQREAASLQPVLFTDGMVLDGFILQSWARFNHQSNPAPGRWVIPSLPPGSYTACLLPVSSAQGSLAFAPQPGRCAEGFLSAGGGLSLEVPRGSESG